MTLSENFNLNAIVLNRFHLTENGGRVFTNLIGCQDKEQRPFPYDTKLTLQKKVWLKTLIFCKNKTGNLYCDFPVHQNQNIARPNRARRRQRQAANSSYNSGTSASSGKKKLFFHAPSSQRINSEFTHDLVSKSRESNNDILGGLACHWKHIQ